MSSGRLTAAFGPGWPKREADLGELVAVRQVRNHWYFGFGFREVPDGWTYNVWGLDAVELEMRDGKVFRIGTNDPDGLHAAASLSRRS